MTPTDERRDESIVLLRPFCRAALPSEWLERKVLGLHRLTVGGDWTVRTGLPGSDDRWEALTLTHDLGAAEWSEEQRTLVAGYLGPAAVPFDALVACTHVEAEGWTSSLDDLAVSVQRWRSTGLDAVEIAVRSTPEDAPLMVAPLLAAVPDRGWNPAALWCSKTRFVLDRA